MARELENLLADLSKKPSDKKVTLIKDAVTGKTTMIVHKDPLQSVELNGVAMEFEDKLSKLTTSLVEWLDLGFSEAVYFDPLIEEYLTPYVKTDNYDKLFIQFYNANIVVITQFVQQFQEDKGYFFEYDKQIALIRMYKRLVT